VIVDDSGEMMVTEPRRGPSDGGPEASTGGKGVWMALHDASVVGGRSAGGAGSQRREVVAMCRSDAAHWAPLDCLPEGRLGMGWARNDC
jgi:hypothetical protein